MLFGVARVKDSELKPEKPVQSAITKQPQKFANESVIMGEDEFLLDQIREERVSQFKTNHSDYTTATASL